nr:RNA recognition motif domain containing protein [Haemonchus contortus]
MDCKVYVGGLPNDATSQEIEDAFYRFGRIRKVWVARRPPGFAFVEFEDSRDAEDAVKALDGSRICGVRARVELSHGRGRGAGGGGGYGGRRSSYTYRSRSPRRDRGRSRSRDRRSRSRSRSPIYRSRSPPMGGRSRSRSRSPGCGCKMNREDIDRIAASTCIIFLSGLVLFQSCHRASTIYFFELQTTTVIFIEPIPAILIPFALSGLLWLIYKGTKRSTMIELERKAIMDKAKEIEAASSPNSRKSSRNESRMESRKVSLVEDIQQAARLNRLLSDIQEQDTIHSQHGRRPSDASDTDQDRKPAGLSPKASTSESSDNAWRLQSQPAPRTMLRSRSSTESDYYRKFSGQRNPRERLYSLDSVSAPCTSGSMTLPDDLRGLSRKSSVSIGGGSVSRLYAGADDSDDDDSERERNAIYQQIGQTNFFTYSLSALNLLPKNRPGLPVLKLNFSDIWSEFFSVHLPIWACVVAFYIVLLELFGVHFGYGRYTVTVGSYQELSFAWQPNITE